MLVNKFKFQLIKKLNLFKKSFQSQYTSAASIGIKLADVDTPCLMLDLDIYEKNLKSLTKLVNNSDVTNGNIKIRPHSKSHKCPIIAKQQINEGAVGVCCQKLSEAISMMIGGVNDILIANEVVGYLKINKLVSFLKSISNNHEKKLTICVDNFDNVSEINKAAQIEGVNVNIIVDINVGANRCGCNPEDAVKLAQHVVSCSNLKFQGLQGYNGAAQHIRNYKERYDTVVHAAKLLKSIKDILIEKGIKCNEITGGGTGTIEMEPKTGIYTEIQPGSYIFMDGDYSFNIWNNNMNDKDINEKLNINNKHPYFEQSLFIYTMVMSTNLKHRRSVVDAGLKATSTDSGYSLVHDLPGLKYYGPTDEHGCISYDDDNIELLKLGEKIKLIPSHCDPTVNLYNEIIGIRNGVVESILPITARGALL
jgi:D-serine deaminase-like pyridoxal phosphate-dependent protein